MDGKLSQGPRAGHDMARVGAGLSRGPGMAKKAVAAAWSNTWPAPGATLDLDFANNRGFVRGVGQGGVMDAITFTRASVGKHVDQDGLVQDAAIGVPRFDWASTSSSNNFLTYSEDFANSVWLTSASSGLTCTKGTTTDTLPFGGTGTVGTATYSAVSGLNTNAFLYQSSTKAQSAAYFCGSIWAKVSSGTATAYLNIESGSQVPGNLNYAAAPMSLTTTWQRFSVSGFLAQPAGNAALVIGFDNRIPPATQSNAGSLTIQVWGAQLDFGTSPAAYVGSSAFPSTSTPLQPSATCNGLLIEESRANRILWCRDGTQTNWTKTNVTAAKDQFGVDGVANAATSLTATADNGTCIQTITLASGSRTGSVYLKRITGTGNVQVSLDGSTWSTVDLSNGLYNRIVLSGNVTNPVVGIRLATNGDAVAMDYGQIEDGAKPTTPILTTTAIATRSIEAASMSGQNFLTWYNQFGGVTYLEAMTTGTPTVNSWAYEYSVNNVSSGVGRGTGVSRINGALLGGGVNGGLAFSTSVSWPDGLFMRSANYNWDALHVLAGNGVIGQTVQSQIVYPTMQQLTIGSSQNSSPLNGCIRRLVFIPGKSSAVVTQDMTGAN